MNTKTNTTTATRSHLRPAFGCAALAGTLAAVLLGSPAWAMHRPSPEIAASHSGPVTGIFTGIFTGGARPGAYLLVRTPMP